MRYVISSFCLILVLLILWQTIVTFFEIPRYILPSPRETFLALYQFKESIAAETLITLLETTLGLIMGVLLGCIAALLIAFFKPLKFWFLPLLIISQAIPTFAIAPLLVIWLGFGLASKIATTTLIIFFPVTSAFYDGLQRTQTEWLNLAKTMHANKWRIFWHIRIPASLPSLASGIRVAAVFAPIGAIMGEWVGSSRGLGYLMLNANARLQIDMMFAALLMIILMATVLYFVIDKLLKHFIWWTV